MKSFILVLGIMLLPLLAIHAQDQKPAVPLTDAEKKFKDLLTDCTMDGRWYSVKGSEMGEEKQDKYQIVSVSKVKGDSWVITTKMKYGGREMSLPLPIEVKFAGDTPVIVVNNLMIPAGGTYSARVVFYQNTYAGSWTGGDHGGLLSGVITPNKK
jgi:hypothetical protein